jgi:hypothetical protein
VACDYLNYVSYTLIGVLWLSMLDTLPNTANRAYAKGKIKTGEFYLSNLLPRAQLHKQAVEQGANAVNATELSDFIG